MKRFFTLRNIVIVPVILIIVAILYASTRDIQWRGKFNYASPLAKSLRIAVKMEFGAQSSAFVGGVGGISFDQIAVPAAGIQVDDLVLNYDPAQENGQRLVLVINGKPVKLGLYDWLLIPVARYSDSPYYSCFTLFGKLADSTLEKTILKQGGRILNYHPDFDNTLIGLRLFHMDILILYEHSADLPMENDQYLLGAGETAPNLRINREGLLNFINHIKQVQKSLKQMHRSYVITDYTREIKFSIHNDSLKISGTPYYFFWRYNYDKPSYNQTAVRDSIDNYYKSIIEQKKSTSSYFDSHKYVIDLLLETAREYQEKHNFYSAGSFVDMLSFTSDEERRKFLNIYAPPSLYDMFITVQMMMHAHTVDHLVDYSQQISNRSDILRAINPAVWDATVTTLQYAAFFRYCKQAFPAVWQQFISEIRDVTIEPVVQTPTIMYPVGNELVEKLLEGN